MEGVGVSSMFALNVTTALLHSQLVQPGSCEVFGLM